MFLTNFCYLNVSLWFFYIKPASRVLKPYKCMFELLVLDKCNDVKYCCGFSNLELINLDFFFIFVNRFSKTILICWIHLLSLRRGNTSSSVLCSRPIPSSWYTFDFISISCHYFYAHQFFFSGRRFLIAYTFQPVNVSAFALNYMLFWQVLPFIVFRLEGR